jgi:polysaccharide biosynthesis transport protein
LTVERFRRKDVLDVSIPKASRLLEVNVEFPDAQLAAALANGLAKGSEELVQQMNVQDTQSTQEFLKRRLDQAQGNLQEAEIRRLRVQQAGHLEDLEKQLAILLSEKEQLSAQNLQLSLGLAQNQSKTSILREALKNEPQTFRLTKSVMSDKLMDRLSEKRQVDQAPPLSITEESLNTTGEEVRRDLINATASTAAETAGIEAAMNRLRRTNAEVEALSQRIATVRNEIEGANHEFKMAQEAVESAARDYRNASVTVSMKSDELKQVAPALVPERPIRPRLLLNTLLGGLMGLVILAVAAALIESIRDLRAQSIRALMGEEPVGVGRS